MQDIEGQKKIAVSHSEKGSTRVIVLPHNDYKPDELLKEGRYALIGVHVPFMVSFGCASSRGRTALVSRL